MIRTVPLLAVLFCPAAAWPAPAIERIQDRDEPFPKAVIVDNMAMLHSGQILPWTKDGTIPAEALQPGQILDNLEEILKAGGSSWSQIVRLNVHGSPTLVDNLLNTIKERHGGKKNAAMPALTRLIGNLPGPHTRLAIDVVAVAGPADKVKYLRHEKLPADGGTAAAILPAGPRAYVSGQAEKGISPAEATRKTLEGLRATLKFLELSDADVVQAKCFLTPMSAREAVVKEFTEFFGTGKVPPLVFVEWKSTLPIEIEMIARAPQRQSSEAIEYLIPPGVKPSPIYSRLARVDADRLIYTGTLTPNVKGDGNAKVKDVFDQLGKLLERTGSDFRHLAKATYFVADDDCWKKLNELRPNYYDPLRPPTASKAMVENIVRPECGIGIDMIAVPAAAKKR
jgi:enamine deaminase RidA (YjgF/YER057c/UK114 family)